MVQDTSLPQESETKSDVTFRVFDEEPATEHGRRVKNNYYSMHEKQTVEYVQGQHDKWCRFDHYEGGILEALDMLNDYVDEVDPDAEFPNAYHAFQTAEAIREKHPDKDWLQLTGLIHDLGKIMGKYGQPPWSTAGDTYPVGCAPRECIPYGVRSFAKCPDIDNPEYNTKFGMYREGCGLENLLISWGHDEYLYQVLKNHPGCSLPKEGLWCIRYHSLYPWHDANEYQELCVAEDQQIMDWVKEFNKFDLYTKADKMPVIEELKPYYQSLIDKYIPGKVRF